MEKNIKFDFGGQHIYVGTKMRLCSVQIKKDLWKESTDNDVQLFPTLFEVGIGMKSLYS